jgi:hypothetical protein
MEKTQAFLRIYLSETKTELRSGPEKCSRGESASDWGI